MAYTSSPYGQYVNVIPDANEDPNIPGDLLALATAIERRSVQVYANGNARDAANTSPDEGQLAYLRGTNILTYYDGAAWQTYPTPGPAITSGTAAPNNANGSNGDIYFQYS